MNGSSSTAVNVKRMFKSIGLNIEHPETFFVQQGRITQIVSFKPLEIMDMLLECAGVALFREIADGTKVLVKDKSEKLDLIQERMKLTFGPRLKFIEKERAKLAEHGSLQALMLEKTKIQQQLNRYLAHRTLSYGSSALSQFEAHLHQQEKTKQGLLDQKNKIEQASTDEAASKRISKDLDELKKQVVNEEANFQKAKLQRQEKARERDFKADRIANLQSKLAAKNTQIARSNAQKDNMEALLARLKTRTENIEEEFRQMANDGADAKGEDPTRPLVMRVEKLKETVQLRKEGIEETRKKVKNIHEHMKTSEKNKKKIETELEELRHEEKGLLKAEGLLKEIVSSVYKRKPNSTILRSPSSDQ